MQWIIIIVIGVIWLVSKLSTKSVSNTTSLYTSNKYKDRHIDTSKTLFERNYDIIKEFENKITDTGYSSYRHRNYEIENTVRDCINDICLAEGKVSIRPASSYLSSWKSGAPSDYVELSNQIESSFLKRKSRLNEIEKDISTTRDRIRKAVKDKKDPLEVRKLSQRDSDVDSDILIEDIQLILSPNSKSWSEKEKDIIKCKTYEKFSLYHSEIENSSIQNLNNEIENYNSSIDNDIDKNIENKDYFTNLTKGYKDKEKDKVIERLNFVINDTLLPDTLPKVWNVDYDPEQSIAIVEVKLPDVVHCQVYKEVQLKSGFVKKPLTQKESREKVPSIHPAIILRTAFEVFRNDISDVIQLLVVNGWVEFDNPSTGVRTKTYTISLAVQKHQIIELNLSKIEPLSAFSSLKGKSAGKLVDIIPVTPVMSLDRKDKRFIETKEVIDKLSKETNLASMDWQDFENLIAELFQREFSEEGTEIRLTQSSRDKGVDAIVFNPDPIRGGKYVIQAKRYTNTVDVSAVRDLVAVVAHEGASRGILVTTSTFGADAYAFVQNKPITLLDGAKLLGLLEKHNYKFKIDLMEARKTLNLQK